MAGHATPEEEKRIDELKRRVDPEASSIEDVLALALSYIEPIHEEDQALCLLEVILRRDPRNSLAKIWIAHCYIHYLMNRKVLERAKVLMESVIKDDPKYAAAAYILLTSILRDLDGITPEHEISLWEAAIDCEPDWPNSHYGLAWAYLKLGRRADAIKEMERAMANNKGPYSGDDIIEEMFETSITGRYADPEFLKREFKRLCDGPEPSKPT